MHHIYLELADESLERQVVKIVRVYSLFVRFIIVHCKRFCGFKELKLQSELFHFHSQSGEFFPVLNLDQNITHSE